MGFVGYILICCMVNCLCCCDWCFEFGFCVCFDFVGFGWVTLGFWFGLFVCIVG